jgi:MFS family permease
VPLKVHLNENMERPRSAQMQVAMTSFLALFSIVGIALYGLPFFYDFWVQEFGWTRAQVTSGNAYSKLFIGPLFGFVAGYMIDKFGPRRMMLTGVVMAGGALIGLSLMSGLFWIFYVCYLFNALGFVCGGPLPNQVLLSRWFDKSRGKAMGFAYVGIGIGGTIVPLLAAWLVSEIGWRGALAVLGGLMILIALPAAYFVKESPEGREEGPKPPMAPISHIFRMPAFYLLAFGSFCSIGALGATNQNLKLFLSLDQGFTQMEAGQIASLILACSIGGRLLMGWLADRWPKKRVMMLIYFLDGSALPLLFFADQPGVMIAFAILFGLGLGGEYMIIPLVVGELFGVKVLGRIMGIILTADGVAEALTPMIVAKMRDATGSYEPGFMLLIALSFIGLLAISFLPGKPKAETAANPAGQ